MSHCSHPAALLPEASECLRRDARKITGPRRSILEILHRHSHPMTSKEIFAQMPKGGCNLATVYRSLHLLESIGLVKRYDFGDNIARFELKASGDDGHHHHLICTRCSTVVKVETCFPPEWEKQIARENGYQKVTHRLEFFGVCPRCATQNGEVC